MATAETHAKGNVKRVRRRRERGKLCVGIGTVYGGCICMCVCVCEFCKEGTVLEAGWLVAPYSNGRVLWGSLNWIHS